MKKYKVTMYGLIEKVSNVYDIIRIAEEATIDWDWIIKDDYIDEVSTPYD
ncbi:MAG: hypothetical protein AB2L13_19465 [Spirochaetota bacterium]